MSTTTNDGEVQTVRRHFIPFQYLGKTGLTAIGAVTGARYRFNAPGAIVSVDARDERSLRAVPHLRAVHAA